jgi:cytochrome b6-f complex iron-sulfur subunit
MMKLNLMDRRSFLSDIGITLAVACTGCLAACSKGGTNGPTPPPQGVNFSLDLNTALQNIGDSLVKSGVIIVRLAAGNDPSSFTAVQAACTHEGTIIGYNTGQGIFICPLHGSEFSKSGAVLLGPASANLRIYNVSIVGETMTITS